MKRSKQRYYERERENFSEKEQILIEFLLEFATGFQLNALLQGNKKHISLSIRTDKSTHHFTKSVKIES